jgi:hypothetical protein
MSVLGKRRARNLNTPNLNEIIREIETNNNPGAYANTLASTFFDVERKSLPIAHTFLLHMLHHIVTSPLSDNTLDNFIIFLMAWEEHPYLTTLVLQKPGNDQPGNDQPGNDQPGNDQYRMYLKDLLMLYSNYKNIPDTIKTDNGLELSNSSILRAIQDSKAKLCPYGAKCTRSNPTHISLMHPPGFKRKGGTLRNKKAKRKAKRTARRTRHSPM